MRNFSLRFSPLKTVKQQSGFRIWRQNRSTVKKQHKWMWNPRNGGNYETNLQNQNSRREENLKKNPVSCQERGTTLNGIILTRILSPRRNVLPFPYCQKTRSHVVATCYYRFPKHPLTPLPLSHSIQTRAHATSIRIITGPSYGGNFVSSRYILKTTDVRLSLLVFSLLQANAVRDVVCVACDCVSHS